MSTTSRCMGLRGRIIRNWWRGWCRSSKTRTPISPKARSMDHHEAVRKFEHLMLKEADHAREVATELEALVPILTTENSRQLAQLQIKASHKQAKEFRELAEKVKEK